MLDVVLTSMPNQPERASSRQRHLHPIEGGVAACSDRSDFFYEEHPSVADPADGGLSIEALANIAAGLAVSAVDRMSGFVGSEGVSVLPLLQTDLYEATLIQWTPAASIELHDHSGSHGVVTVVQGKLVEAYSDRFASHPVRTRIIHTAQFLTLPKFRRHSMWNPGLGTALSVHVFSPDNGENQPCFTRAESRSCLT